MGLDVGSVYAKLGARLDDAGFDRFERRLKGVRHDADKGATAHLGAKADTHAVDTYNRKVNEAQANAKEGATAHLGAKADTSGIDRYNRKVDEARGGSGHLKGALAGAAGGFAMLGPAAAVGGAAVGALAVKAVSAASDINESLSKNVVLFGKYAADVDKFSQTSAKSYGLSRTAVLEYTGTFGNLFGALGLSKKASAENSVALTKLAADMASFNNTSTTDALDAIRSGLVGETEPLRRFGVNMNDATLKIEAHKLAKRGLIDASKAEAQVLDPQTKALAAQSLIFKQTSAAHGDFARTSGGLANQQRILTARIQDGAAALGAKLLPAALFVVKGLNDLTSSGGKAGGILDKVRHYAELAKDVVITAARPFVELGKVAVTAVTRIAAAFSDTFGGNSGTGRDLKTIGRAILAFRDAVFDVYTAVAKRALPGIVQAFQGFARVVRGIIRIIAGILTGDFGKAWDGVKDVFGGALKTIGGVLRAGTAPLRAAAAAIGKAIGGAFSGAWDGIVSVAEGFVNRIIDVLNIIPGVHLKHVGGSSGGVAGDTGYRPTSGTKTGTTQRHGGVATDSGTFSTAGAALSTIPAYAQGGKVTEPIAIMGEEAPTHPEWVIPENPAYRGRAMKLWAMAGRAIGVPGFSLGGLFDPGKALKFVESVSPVGKVLSTAAGLAGKIAGKLPGNPGGILRDTYGYALDKAGDFITGKAGGILDAAKSALSAVTGGGGGGAGTGGLVPQVLRAIAWARAHGWHGGIISGVRSRAAQLIAATGYARRTGQTLAQAYPNGIYASGHLRGVAIDVGDRAGFARAMASAPADSRLYSRIPADPSHFSVTGYARGGLFDVGGRSVLGGLGLAFAQGGKRPARTKLDSSGLDTHNRFLKRAASRRFTGLPAFEASLNRQEKGYDQATRRYDLTEEVFLVEGDDGTVTVDEAAVSQRLGELANLHVRREGILDTTRRYRTAVTKAISAYRKAITGLQRLLKAATGKGSAVTKRRAGYRQAIDTYRGRIGELKTTAESLGFDVGDALIDLKELDKEILGVKQTKPDAPTGGGELETTTGATLGDAPSASDVPGFFPDTGQTAASGDNGSGGASAPSIAEAVTAALASFNAGRVDLFGQFGANFASSAVLASGQATAAGVKAFGGNLSGADAAAGGSLGQEVGTAGKVVNVTNNFAAPPPDPHLWTRQAEFELNAA